VNFTLPAQEHPMMQKLLHNGTFSTMLNIFQLLISTPHSGHPSDFDTIMWCCCGGAAVGWLNHMEVQASL
jgi:hypothetical protein